MSFGAERPRRFRSRRTAAQALRRFPLPAGDGQDVLLPIGIGADQHEERGLAGVEPGFHIHPVGPEVDEAAVGETAMIFWSDM